MRTPILTFFFAMLTIQSVQADMPDNTLLHGLTHKAWIVVTQDFELQPSSVAFQNGQPVPGLNMANEGDAVRNGPYCILVSTQMGRATQVVSKTILSILHQGLHLDATSRGFAYTSFTVSSDLFLACYAKSGIKITVKTARKVFGNYLSFVSDGELR